MPTPSGTTGSGQTLDQILGSLGIQMPIQNPSQLTGTGQTIGGNASAPVLDFNNPPPMKTLVYSPEVRILMAHNNSQYDVSKDVVRGGIIRRENACSSTAFSLSNKDRRYNDVFMPMDRVVIYLKRIDWVQVFSGYLDSVPHGQMYGGEVNFRATCTLKRLVHTWWDPGLSASQAILGYGANTGMAVAGDGQSIPGTALGEVLHNVLVQVGGWNAQNIHIQNFPMKFLQEISQNYTQEEQQSAQAVDAFNHLFLGDYTALGIGEAAGQDYQTGAPGAYYSTGAGQVQYVNDIIASCDAHGLGPDTMNLNISQQGAIAAQQGTDSQERDSPAWQQYQNTFTNWNQQTKNVDAAIIGVATALAESQLMMQANNNDPETLNYPHDSMRSSADSGSGLYGQQNTGAWGSPSQRMNARQSSDMFFNKLATTDWRNMDPGASASLVQQNNVVPTYVQKVDAVYQTALGLVQAARQAGTTGQQQLTGLIPGASSLGSLGGLGGLTSASGGLSSLSTAASGLGGILPTGASAGLSGSPAPATGGGGGGGVGSALGGVQPDAAGAVAAIQTLVGTPYSESNPQIPHVAMDCSGTVTYAYRAIGIDLGRTTWDIRDHLQGHEVRQGSPLQPGDVFLTNGFGHTFMYIGNNMVFDNGGPGPATTRALSPSDQANANGIYRVCAYGGNPTFNPIVSSTGVPPGTVGTSTAGTAPGQGASQEDLARNIYTYMFYPSLFAPKIESMFSDAERSFMEGQPLIQIVAALSKAGLRNFCSAPNGDFVAYYPDYFGVDGKPAVLNLEDIEMKNVRIDFSDDTLATHVYVTGQENYYGDRSATTPLGYLQSMGVATVENEWLFQKMIAIAPGNLLSNMSSTELLRKFGPRPLMQEFAEIEHGPMEKLLAIQIFMERWAEMYRTQVEFTFMPELFPGMRLNLKNHGIQVYTTQVEHQWDYERGFFTTANIMAPSSSNQSNQLSSTGTATTAPATIPDVSSLPQTMNISPPGGGLGGV